MSNDGWLRWTIENYGPGRSARQHMKDDGVPWDTNILGQVLLKMLPKLLKPKLEAAGWKIEAIAKLRQDIEAMLESRQWLAHPHPMPTVNEMISAISATTRVVETAAATVASAAIAAARGG